MCDWQDTFLEFSKIYLTQIFAQHEQLVVLVVVKGMEGEAGKQGQSAVAHKVVLGEHTDGTIPEMGPQLLGLTAGYSFGRT